MSDSVEEKEIAALRSGFETMFNDTDRDIAQTKLALIQIRDLEQLTQERLRRLSSGGAESENPIQNTNERRESLCSKIKEAQELMAEMDTRLAELYCLKAELAKELLDLDDMDESREQMSEAERKLNDRMLRGDS